MGADGSTHQGAGAPAATARSPGSHPIAIALKLTASALAFVGALLGSLAMHADLPVTRRVVRDVANRALHGTLRGELEVGPVEQLNASGIRVGWVTVHDAEGRQVLDAKALDAQLDVAHLARVWWRDGVIDLRIASAHLAHAHVTLVPVEGARPSLADAFLPRATSASAGTPVVVRVEEARIETADVDGSVGVPIEARIEGVLGRVEVDTRSQVAVRVERARIEERRLVGASTRGEATLDLTTELGRREGESVKTRLQSDLIGAVGTIAVTAHAELEDRSLRLEARVPRAAPSDMRGTLPWLPLDRPVTARAVAQGEFPRLAIGAELEIEQPSRPSKIAVEGLLELERGDTRLSFHGPFESFELQSLGLSGVALPLFGEAHLDVRVHEGDTAPFLRGAVSTRAARFEGKDVPAVDATFELKNDHVVADVAFEAADSSLGGRIDYAGGLARFEVTTQSADLGALRDLRGRVAGRVERAELEGFVEGRRFEARAKGRAVGVEVRALGANAGKVRAAQLDFVAQAKGTLDTVPEIDAVVSVRDLVGLGPRLPHAELRARGPAMNPWFDVRVNDDAGGELTIASRADLGASRLSAITATLRRNELEVRAHAATLELGTNGGIRAERLTLDPSSVAELPGRLDVRGADVVGSWKKGRIDLDKLARLVGWSSARVRGVAEVDLELRSTRQGRSGVLDVRLRDGEFGLLRSLGGAARVELEGDALALRGVDGRERAELAIDDGRCAKIAARGDARLSGSPLDAAAWRGLIGQARVEVERVDLACLARKLPSALPPSLSLSGSAVGGFTAERDAIDVPWSVAGLALAVQELRVVGLDPKVRALRPSGAPTTIGPQPEMVATRPLAEARPSSRECPIADAMWCTQALDGALFAAFDGSDGSASFSLLIDDRAALRGGKDAPLATLSAAMNLPLAALAHGSDPWRALRDAPLEASFVLSERPLASLAGLVTPALPALGGLDGQVSLAGTLAGSLGAPYAYLTSRARGVSARRDDRRAPWFEPIDLHVVSTYEADDAKLVTAVDVFERTQPTHAERTADPRVCAHVEATLETELERWWDPTGEAPSSPRVGLFARLDDLPLRLLPIAEELDVDGRASGTIALAGLGASPSLEANVELPYLRIGESFFDARIHGRGGVKPGASGFVVDGQGELEIAIEGQSGGTLEARGAGGLRWLGAMVPLGDPTSPGELAIEAHDFRLDAIQPIVRGWVEKVDGQLDGSARVLWGRIDETEAGYLEHASLRVREGVLFLPKLGQELRSVTATLEAEPPREGTQRVRLAGVEASAVAGRLRAEGAVLLQGLVPSKGEATITIAEGEELPITFEGVSLGTAHGEVELGMRRLDEGVELAVDVRRADFELPTSSSRDVMGLEEAPGIRVLTPTIAATSRETARGRPWALSVRLGDVRVHSSTLDVRLKTNAASPLSIALDDRVTTRGEIVVDRGSIVLNKRDFEVDSAVVRLNEDDAANPYLAATAHWDGPANRVFVDYVGTLKPFGGDKLRFRSDPPKSQAEIVQSLLFGDTTGGNLVGNVSATVATMLANDIIASAFGGALRDVLALDLGTTETGGFVGAKVDLSDAWSFGGKLNPFGANAASRTPGGGCGDFFFDYRISRAWSLRGTGGYCDYEDQTSTSSNQDGISLGIDVLWRYRY